MGVLSKNPPVFPSPFCGENVKECPQMSGDLKNSTVYLTSPSGRPKNVTDTRVNSRPLYLYDARTLQCSPACRQETGA